MKHYIAVSLDVEYNNVVIIGFGTEKKADNAIEKLNFYGNKYYGCAWFSVDYYGHCEEQEVRSYYKYNNIIQVIDRKNPLNNMAISAIGKTLWAAYNETFKQR